MNPRGPAPISDSVNGTECYRSAKDCRSSPRAKRSRSCPVVFAGGCGRTISYPVSSISRRGFRNGRPIRIGSRRPLTSVRISCSTTDRFMDAAGYLKKLGCLVLPRRLRCRVQLAIVPQGIQNGLLEVHRPPFRPYRLKVLLPEAGAHFVLGALVEGAVRLVDAVNGRFGRS